MQESEASEDASQYLDSDYESSTDGQRPGRFYGPDSSWRWYTEDERALTASLQQDENNDLSLALFNVHALRARAHDLGNVSSVRPWHTKGRWIQADREGNIPFQPPPQWAAWPLKPELVPRTREVWGKSAPHPEQESESYSKSEAWKPSLNLQEELKALFLRQAKRRFDQREQEEDSEPASQSGRSALSHRSSSSADDEQVSTDDERTKTFPHGASSPTASSSTPLFMADDDLIDTILQPTVRHVISSQHKLLAALHESRRGHRLDPSLTTRAKRNEPAVAELKARPAPNAGPVRKRKRVVSDVIAPQATTKQDLDRVETVSDHTRKARGQYVRLPGQRDWSEVLGIAAMAGCGPSVIDRTARRCAAIFGETMSMRFMGETSADTSRDSIVEYVPDMVPPIETPAETQKDHPAQDLINACPHTSCRRHYEPYEKHWRLREHLKKSHKYNANQLKKFTLKRTECDRHAARPADFPREVGRDRDGEDEEDSPAESERDDFLQPITVPIGRSRDKRTRASRSRSRSVPAMAVSEDDAVGGGSAMSTDSEL